MLFAEFLHDAIGLKLAEEVAAISFGNLRYTYRTEAHIRTINQFWLLDKKFLNDAEDISVENTLPHERRERRPNIDKTVRELQKHLWRFVFRRLFVVVSSINLQTEMVLMRVGLIADGCCPSHCFEDRTSMWACSMCDPDIHRQSHQSVARTNNIHRELDCVHEHIVSVIWHFQRHFTVAIREIRLPYF